jgi:A/G-specific adenine glycosylase
LEITHRSEQKYDGGLDVSAIQERLLNWGAENRREFPWRTRIPFWQGLLVEVLLQRTRAAQVTPVFKSLKQQFPVAHRLTDMTTTDADEFFSSLGLTWRATHFVQLAWEIGRRRGRLKRDYLELQKLPGVGPYAAAAALSLHGEVRHEIVDSNTVRIVCRLLGNEFDAETRRKRWVHNALESITPELEFRAFNFALLDLGAEVCRPRNQLCDSCPLLDLCVTGQSRTSE